MNKGNSDYDNKRGKIGSASGIIGIVCNILLASAKLVAGIMSGMMSVIADAINNYSDAVSGIVSLIGFKMGSKPADDEHPFGHSRYEYIAGLIVAFLIMIAGIELLKEGILKIVHPAQVTYSALVYVVLIVSIVIKAGMSLMNYTLSKAIDSTLLLAVAEDSRNDVITTGAVLLAALASKYMGYNLDGIMSVLVAAFVLYSGCGLVKDTIEPLLGTTPDAAFVDAVEEKILSYDKVLGTHDLMVHDYGPGRRFASVHVEVPAESDVLECHEIIDTIEQDFLEDMGLHMVIHYDPIVTSDEAVGSIRTYLANQAREIHEDMTIHDVRVVPGDGNTNVIFDCVVPYTCKITEEAIRQEFANRLIKKYPNHTAVVKIDHSFVSLN